MTPDALILFFKYPERGRVKTRLASSFGEDFVLGLYCSFIKDILSMSESVKADKIIVIGVNGNVPSHLLDLGTGYKMIRQKGKDMGARMLNAFLQVFELGYQSAVLIGGDSPDLPAEFVESALESLSFKDAVLGGSTDGGYYLIGFRRRTCAAEFFHGISWSTPSVFRETIDKITESGKSLYLLPEWKDIDEEDDLKTFYKEKSKEGGVWFHTIEFINENMNKVE